MPIRIEDLPPALRQQALEQAGTQLPTQRVARGAKSPGLPVRCHTCDEHFDTYGKAAEDHSAQPGHTRIELVLTTTRT